MSRCSSDSTIWVRLHYRLLACNLHSGELVLLPSLLLVITNSHCAFIVLSASEKQCLWIAAADCNGYAVQIVCIALIYVLNMLVC